MKQACALSLRDLFDYLPLLGFILRSTNVRNTFEVFAPLLDLIRDVLDGKNPSSRTTRLILSSEWDFSPLMFDQIPNLPNFVFIGLPASESANPLLIPLAGHELGHSVWAKQRLRSQIEQDIHQAILAGIKTDWNEFQTVFNVPVQIQQTELANNLFLVQTWEPILASALGQTEETFCDFIGLRLFGESYLHSFAYLLSPSHSGERSPQYPSMKTRVRNLVAAANSYGITCPNGYVDEFEDDLPASPSETKRFRLKIADQALARMIDTIVRKADEIVRQSGTVLSSHEEIERIRNRFSFVVPAENCKCLADVINAGWRVFLDPTFWNTIPQIFDRRASIIKELALKTIEVFQIERLP